MVQAWVEENLKIIIREKLHAKNQHKSHMDAEFITLWIQLCTLEKSLGSTELQHISVQKWHIKLKIPADQGEKTIQNQ